MKVFLQLLCCISCIVLMGCETQQKTVVHHSHQPRFIDDIYMDSHNKSSTTTNGVSRYKAPPEPKYAEGKHAPQKEGEAEPKANPEGNIRVGGDITLADKYAILLNVRPRQIDNPSLFSFIEEWYGTDYQRGGNDKAGIDCSAFVQKLYGQVFGKDLLRTSFEQFQSCEHLTKSSDQAAEGDLVFFKIHSHHVTHVGVYLMNDYFVHASTSQGVVISNLKDEYWRKYLAGIGHVARG